MFYLGRTPDQLCFCSSTRKELPSRYHTLKMTKKQVAAVEDIERIFELVRDPAAFEDLQIMLQVQF